MEDKVINTRYLTCSEWCKEHSWPPFGGLRHLIFHAATNGFDKVIRRCGRRVLLNEQEFFKFIEEKKGTYQQVMQKTDKNKAT